MVEHLQQIKHTNIGNDGKRFTGGLHGRRTVPKSGGPKNIVNSPTTHLLGYLIKLRCSRPIHKPQRHWNNGRNVGLRPEHTDRDTNRFARLADLAQPLGWVRQEPRCILMKQPRFWTVIPSGLTHDESLASMPNTVRVLKPYQMLSVLTSIQLYVHVGIRYGTHNTV